MEVDYDPKTLDECYAFLDKFFTEGKDIFKDVPEDEIAADAHHTLGRWLRNKWNLWWTTETANEVKKTHPNYPQEMPPIVRFFKDLGVFHPDDMSSIVIVGYHKKLTDKPFDLDAEIVRIKEFYTKEDDENA